jgi:hypothetical protein
MNFRFSITKYAQNACDVFDASVTVRHYLNSDLVSLKDAIRLISENKGNSENPTVHILDKTEVEAGKEKLTTLNELKMDNL